MMNTITTDTKGVFQAHAENIERNLNTLINNLNLNNEDHITKIYALTVTNLKKIKNLTIG